MATDPLPVAIDLIRAESVTPAGPAVFDVVEKALSAAGFAVERVTFAAQGTAPVENLFATRGSGRQPRGFAGHVPNVVPPRPRRGVEPPPLRCRPRKAYHPLRAAAPQGHEGPVAAMIPPRVRRTGRPDGGPGGRLSFLVDRRRTGAVGQTARAARRLGRRSAFPMTSAFVAKPTPARGSATPTRSLSLSLGTLSSRVTVARPAGPFPTSTFPTTPSPPSCQSARLSSHRSTRGTDAFELFYSSRLRRVLFNPLKRTFHRPRRCASTVRFNEPCDLRPTIADAAARVASAAGRGGPPTRTVTFSSRTPASSSHPDEGL